VEEAELPAMIVDMEAVNNNVDEIVNAAKESGHTIRIATKVVNSSSASYLQSVRVPALIRHILERGAPTVKGLMCYSTAEAEFLYNEFGFDDLLIAYPAVQKGTQVIS
jgi:D-serine deaminase-like pyridoxal phosphate-dependent protein